MPKMGPNGQNSLPITFYFMVQGKKKRMVNTENYIFFKKCHYWFS